MAEDRVFYTPDNEQPVKVDLRAGIERPADVPKPAKPAPAKTKTAPAADAMSAAAVAQQAPAAERAAARAAEAAARTIASDEAQRDAGIAAMHSLWRDDYDSKLSR